MIYQDIHVLHFHIFLNLTGKKARGPKASKLPDPLPEGDILKDIKKGQWKIGKAIGAGGFGLIYSGNTITNACMEKKCVRVLIHYHHHFF